MGGAQAHSKAKRYVDGGNQPLEDDHEQHDPWGLVPFLEEYVTAGPTKCSVDTWTLKEMDIRSGQLKISGQTVEESLEPDGGEVRLIQRNLGHRLLWREGRTEGSGGWVEERERRDRRTSDISTEVCWGELREGRPPLFFLEEKVEGREPKNKSIRQHPGSGFPPIGPAPTRIPCSPVPSTSPPLMCMWRSRE